MKKLVPQDLLDIAAYEKVREQRLDAVIRLKKHRRVAVGPLVTLVFENRETIRSQIQEMMRAERLVQDAAIQAELDVYNELLPGDGQIAATLYIEVDDPGRVREVLDQFIGLDEPGHVVMRFSGGAESPAVFESGRSREDRISAVQFVRFSLDETAARALGSGNGTATIEITHPAYRASGEIPPEVRRSLASDLDPGRG
jgi:hypothetical protein